MNHHRIPVGPKKFIDPIRRVNVLVFADRNGLRWRIRRALQYRRRLISRYVARMFGF